jgi:thiol-disulfide isomerase/thioredoxin
LPQGVADRVHAEARRIMGANGGRALFSEIYNAPEVPAAEREYAARLYEVFFALPSHLASEKRRSGRIPSKAEIAANFGLGPDAVDLLLEVAVRDPRLPKLLQRDPASGEVASLDLLVIDDFVAKKGTSVQVSGWAGRPLPDFSLTALDGSPVIAASLRGHPTLIFLWLTRCPVCRRITPEVVELDQRYRERGLRVVGLCADDTLGLGVPAEERAAWIKEQGIGYTIALLDGPSRAALGNQNIFPAMFLVAADGKVAELVINYHDLPSLEALLKPLLAPAS